MEAAWQKAKDLLAIKPVGPNCERLLLYLFPLTLHYGYPNTMRGFIECYYSRINSYVDSQKRNRAFSNALKLIFTALTDQDNQKKIAVQLEAVDWEKLTKISILQTFRFIIENHRQNPKAANEAILCAIRAAKDFYEKALVAAAICKHQATKNRFCNSISIAKRSLELLQTDNSLRAGFLRAQLYGHIGKTNQALGCLSPAEISFSNMTKLLSEYRSFAPGQQYFGNLAHGAKINSVSLPQIRNLILKEISSLSTKWPYQRNRLLLAFFSLNDLAIGRRDFQESWIILNSIRKQLRNVNQRELSGYYYRDLAKYFIYEGKKLKTNPGIVNAIFQKAENAFSKLGKKGRHGKATTLLIKGEWLLQKKKYIPVTACIRSSFEIAKSLQNHHLVAHSILLESFLLIESDLDNKVDIYEGILCKIHTIRHPNLLFRILANLYIYSWEFPTQLNVTGLLIQNIRSLQTSIPKPIFRKLWKQYVSNKVFSRLLPYSSIIGTEPLRLC